MNVKVHRNLNRKDAIWFSIIKDGIVQGYSQEVVLRNVKMKHANPEQIHRVRFGGKRGEGCREVCQWLTGELTQQPNATWRRLICDPRDADGFNDEETGQRIDRAQYVWLSDRGYYYSPTPNGE